MEQSSSSCQHQELLAHGRRGAGGDARVSRCASHPHFYPTCERGPSRARKHAWKDKRRILLYRLFGSKGFMPCAIIKSLFAGLSKLAVPCKFANLPRESRNVRITVLPNHPSSQEDDPGDIRRGGSLHSCAPRLRGVRPRFIALSSRGRLSTFPLHHIGSKISVQLS
jgi:hypothetical protein